MRRIIMFNRVSADGYFATTDGQLDWPVPEPTLDAAAAGRIAEPGTILFGRVTYQGFESFWPRAIDDSPTAPAPHGEPRRSPELRAMGVWINRATKLVFSKTLTKVTWQGARLIRAFNPAEIAALKREPGNDIMIFGSGTIVSQLTQHGLIDEYQLVVAPILLGDGKSLFRGIPAHTRLRLEESTAYPNGNVVLRYARAS
ncbi:MAG: dihydrofolate reductase family protein [Kofleriaceae bacterium]